MSLDAALSDKELLAESERRLAARGTVSPIVRRALEDLHPRSKVADKPSRRLAAATKPPKAAPSVDLAQLKFYGLLALAGLPEPITEHKFCPTRRFRFDYCWPGEMVALEVDGAIWTGGRHTRGSGFKRDCEKMSEAAAMGFRVLRCQPDQLATPYLIDLLKRALSYGQPRVFSLPAT